MNSGKASELIFAPKASLIYSVTGEHGALPERRQRLPQQRRARHDDHGRPAERGPADKVNPLVDSHEVEVGFRTFVDRKLNVSAALWLLELDSELLFIGDAGNTQASRPSRRYGLEVPLYYRPSDRLTFDVELALTRSGFTEPDPAGDEFRARSTRSSRPESRCRTRKVSTAACGCATSDRGR